MDASKTLELNLKRWRLLCPKEAETVLETSYKHTELVKSVSGLLNLVLISGDKKISLYSDHPKEEAQEWFNSLNLDQTYLVYVYGIGLGYYYDAIADWLHKDPLRKLIFIEQEPEILRRLLEIEQGTKLLNDVQVRIYLVLNTDLESKEWQEIIGRYSEYPYQITSLRIYERKGAPFIQSLRLTFSFFTNIVSAMKREYASGGLHFFKNYYPNVSKVPFNYLSTRWENRFKDIPAIICGAGPSLDKNGKFLKSLEEKALIFAGGTAMNAVNSKGVIPHLGVGIDPNDSQYTRLIMNTAYEVPYLYRNRMYHEALELIQGMKIYVPGSIGYRIGNWYDKALGIEGKEVLEGFNVINFSLALAINFGCNPIILTGMDLAYTDQKKYSAGVKSHAVHTLKRHFSTKTKEEELIEHRDIYGNSIYTLWKWLAESSWFSQFALKHSNVTILNATEGGIGFSGIKNVSLNEAASLLPIQRDYRVFLHGEIQLAKMPIQANDKNLKELHKKLLQSLKKCLELLENQKKTNNINEEWKEQIAYEYLLCDFEKYIKKMTLSNEEEIIFDHTLTEEKKQEVEQILRDKRLSFLINVCKLHKELLENLPQEEKSSIESKCVSYKPSKEELYEFTDKRLTIVDLECGIHIDEEIPKELVSKCLNDLNGNLQFEEYYLEDKLYGPVTYYSESKDILGRSWYYNGVKQGKTLLYYLNNSIYAIQRYKDGVFDGTQEYYHSNGVKKSVISYSQGLLDGEVILFFFNGIQKRQLSFVKGLRHGLERLWNEKGVLLMEAYYEQDIPKGIARTWYDNGQLIQEIHYKESGKIESIKRWDRIGNEIAQDDLEDQDFFDSIAIRSQDLSFSLDFLAESLRKVAAMSSKKEETAEDLLNLREQLIKLKLLGKELAQEVEDSSQENKEILWKTPSVQYQVSKDLEEITQKLRDNVKEIESQINLIINPNDSK